LSSLGFILTSPKSDEELERYYQFRWEQLRKPLHLPLGSERDPLDAQSFHCVALVKYNSVIGVGSIQSSGNDAMRIRYMSVAADFRRLGIGSAIIKKLLEHAIENNSSKCWLNARSNAVRFYQQQGFEVVGKVKTDLALPHFKMQTSLIG
jgi:ribosomal protein S18 acetylase RimI-like enzyme